MKSSRVLVLAALVIIVAVVTWLVSSPGPPAASRPSPGLNASLPSTGSAPSVTEQRAAAPSPDTSRAEPPAATASPGSPAANHASADSAETQSLEASPTSPAASPVAHDPRIDLDKVHRMFTNYHTLMGENPVGTNAEIMKAIMGGNSRQATLGPPDGEALNDKGELVDQWGTPYFFHQLSKDHMEIRSAGPDKVMGTDDDVILP